MPGDGGRAVRMPGVPACDQHGGVLGTEALPCGRRAQFDIVEGPAICLETPVGGDGLDVGLGWRECSVLLVGSTVVVACYVALA